MTALIIVTACFAGSVVGAVAWRLSTQRLLDQEIEQQVNDQLANAESPFFHAGDYDRD